MVAGLITAFVVSAISMALGQLGNAKSSGKMHLEAYLRADAALSMLQRDIAAVLRRRDLFWTRLLLTDGVAATPRGHMDRDEILVFNTRLRPIRDLDFIGEGVEYETQYRIEEDDLGPVLWRRADPVPDEYLFGGGMAVPVVAGIVSVSLEAYDGDLWYPEWDSDYDGIPVAIRATVVASGQRPGQDPFEAPLATLRTVIPLDRVPLPVEDVPDEFPDEAVDALDDAGIPADSLPDGLDGSGGVDTQGDTGDGGSSGSSSGSGTTKLDAIRGRGR